MLQSTRSRFDAHFLVSGVLFRHVVLVDGSFIPVQDQHAIGVQACVQCMTIEYSVGREQHIVVTSATVSVVLSWVK